MTRSSLPDASAASGDGTDQPETTLPEPVSASPVMAASQRKGGGRAALWIILGGGAALIGIVAGLVVVTGVDEVAQGDQPMLQYRAEIPANSAR